MNASKTIQGYSLTPCLVTCTGMATTMCLGMLMTNLVFGKIQQLLHCHLAILGCFSLGNYHLRYASEISIEQQRSSTHGLSVNWTKPLCREIVLHT